MQVDCMRTNAHRDTSPSPLAGEGAERQRKSDVSDLRQIIEWPNSGKPEFGWREAVEGASSHQLRRRIFAKRPLIPRCRSRRFASAFFDVKERQPKAAYAPSPARGEGANPYLTTPA